MNPEGNRFRRPGARARLVGVTRRALLVALAPLLAACAAPSMDVTVEAWGDGDAVRAAGAYARDPQVIVTDPKHRAVLALVEESLQEVGLERAEAAAPDVLLLSASVRTEESDLYVPPSVETHPVWYPGRTRRYRIVEDGTVRWVTVHEPGDWVSHTWTRPGYVVHRYRHELEVALVKSDSTPWRETVWRGRAEGLSPNPDPLHFARLVLPLLMEGFPDRQGARRLTLTLEAPPAAAATAAAP